MKKNDRIKYLNENYSGAFRALTDEEVVRYSKQVTQNNSTWEEPYAIREETNDLVCTSDSHHQSTDFLFVRIKGAR